MPLVAHSPLPSFERLRREGYPVAPDEPAVRGDRRDLHIGLLNIMPDAALEATERQFMRLLTAGDRDARLFVHPFTVGGLPRGAAARRHIESHYGTFERLRSDGLHALIITGANVTEADITREPFYGPLMKVAAWGWQRVPSVLCSCLATHAVWKHYHDIDRTHLERKRWGVFSHRIVDPVHPLVQDVNRRFRVPHSRFNDVPRPRIESAGMQVLAESEEAGVLLATSADGFRYVYFQGHPEYDTRSLLKEYKREVFRFLAGDRPDYPPHPDHYFSAAADAILSRYREALLAERSRGGAPPEFPETRLEADLENTWADSGAALFRNWIGLVYELAHEERRELFRPGIRERDPLGVAARPEPREGGRHSRSGDAARS